MSDARVITLKVFYIATIIISISIKSTSFTVITMYSSVPNGSDQSGHLILITVQARPTLLTPGNNFR